MPVLRILGTVALLTVGGELPLFAQAAIQEPSAFAFYHPDADVLNAGRPSFPPFDSTNASSDLSSKPDAPTRTPQTWHRAIANNRPRR
jgi:hypothetical protein